MSVDIDSPVGFATFEAPDDALPDAIDGAVVDEELAGMVDEFMDLVADFGISEALSKWTLRTAQGAHSIMHEMVKESLMFAAVLGGFPANDDGFAGYKAAKKAVLDVFEDGGWSDAVNGDPADSTGGADTKDAGETA